MKISLNWLKQYVNFNISPEKLAGKLTNVGLEVENIEYLGDKYKSFVVGKVLNVNKHPNANKLTVCEVDVRTKKLQIICGAPNVAEGQKVAVGLDGAIIPQNQHDPEKKPFKLSKVMIRGVESDGMICSEFELGIGDDKDGILVLDNIAKVGTSLATYLSLNDIVFDIGITPNRPDCLSHIGIAREVAAILNKQLAIPKIELNESKSPTNKEIKIEIKDAEKCPRYTARIIKGIKVGPSPKWIQKYLSAVGVRPINNIVDVTNYVLMETGHPLHAFDYDNITGKKIIVRQAVDGEHFVTLDGKGRELKNGMLLICDNEKPVALAGVMGGMNSEISEETKNILLESAYFNSRNIRTTAKLLGLTTNASTRFERGADPNITTYAIDRAAQLIAEIAGGKILKSRVDAYPRKIKPLKVNLQLNKVNEILGTELNNSQIIKILNSINIKKIASEKNKLKFEVPTFRPDLEREIDLIEEIARIYGYDNIETKTNSQLKFSLEPDVSELTDELKNWLVGRGFNEVVTNSLQRKDISSLTSDHIVELLNPISRDMATMRTSLLISMLEIIRNNIYHQNKNLSLYEIGRVYFKLNDVNLEQGQINYFEEERLILAKTGLSEIQNWSQTERYSDIFDIKGEVEDILQKILLDKYKFIPYSTTKALVDQGISIEIQDVEVGYIGKATKEILKQFDIEQDVILAELSVDKLRKFVQTKKRYDPLPNFPMIIRDLAFVIDRKVPVEELKQSIRLYAGELLIAIELFDIYSGDQIDKGKKSCAFSLQFLSREKTLTDKEIDAVINKIVSGLNKNYNAILRK